MSNVKKISCGMVNCYLISEGDSSILVDTGISQFKDKVVKLCENTNVRLIVLTHGHIDHIQNAAYLSQKLKAPIAIHKGDAELTQNNLLQPLKAKGLLGKLLLLASVRSFKKDKVEEFTPSIFLKDEDTLKDYGIDARIVGLEGHTKGSIGLDIKEKYFICGDALMNMPSPSISRLFHDKAQMLKSAMKISNLGDRIIYFGHGGPKKNRSWVIEEE